MAADRISRKLKRFSFAIGAFVSFLMLSAVDCWSAPKNEEAAFLRAQTLWKQKKWDDAAMAFEAYLADHPDGRHAPQAFMNMGQFVEGFGRFDEALDFYQQGFELSNGRMADVLLTEIASVHAKKGQFAEAIQIYQTIMKETKNWDLFKVANRNLKAVVRVQAGQGDYGKQSNKCGEESLRAVLKRLGKNPQEKVLNEIASNQNSKGVSLESLRQASLAHGLKAQAVYFKDKGIADIPVPAILHFHPGHYVVLESVGSKGANILDSSDPRQAQKLLRPALLKKMWTGKALCFSRLKMKTNRVELLSTQQTQDIQGGDNWWHSGILSFLQGLGSGEDNPNTAYFDPPNIFVNTLTLNFVVEEVDAVWKGITRPLVLSRTYNADDSEAGMFGNSWRFSYEFSIEENPDDSVTLTRGSGKREVFTSRGDGTYAPPLAVFDKLLKNPDNTFTLLLKKTKQNYNFDSTGKLIAIVDNNGNEIELLWADNKVTSMIVHYGPSITRQIDFTYGSSGFCERIDLPDGRFATFEYDAQGNLIKSKNLAGYETSFGYNEMSFLNSITDSKGSTNIIYQTTIVGGGLYVVKSITNAEDSQWSFSNNFGYPTAPIVTVTDPNGHQTTYTGHQTIFATAAITNAVNSVTSFSYDTYGNRTSLTDANGNTWTFSYGTDPSRGKLTGVVDPMGIAVAFTYDANDNITQMVAPFNRGANFQYDSNQNLIKAIDAMLNEIDLNYNSLGLLTSLLLPGSPRPQINFTYDDFGNVVSESDPESRTNSFVHDISGRVISKIDANGNLTQFQYNALNKITQISQPDGITNYEYDCCTLKRVQAKDGRTMIFSNDSLNRLVSYQDLNGFIIQYDYDPVGNLVSLTYPGNKTVTYEYDEAYHLSSVIDWLSNQTSYSYDKVGNPIKITYSNGTSVKSAYDKNNRLIAHENIGIPGNPLPRFAYKIDALGNRIGETRKNIIMTEPAAQNVTYTYDRADRIQTSGFETFQHDNNGNLLLKAIQSTTTNYSYDYNDMLVQFQSSSSLYLYEYDPLLNRISRNIGLDTSFFVININSALPHILIQTNANKNPTKYYVYGRGLISSIDSTNNVRYYHYDGLGSTVAITNSSGNLVNSYSYEPFGEKLSIQESTDNLFKYIGRFGVIEEGNGLLYMRARYYSDTIGRFLNKDSVGLLGGVNRYSYAMGNPLKFIDPAGLTPAPTEIAYERFRNTERITYAIGGALIGLASATAVGITTGPWLVAAAAAGAAATTIADLTLDTIHETWKDWLKEQSKRNPFK